MTCLCGCGRATKPRRRFVSGHNSRMPEFRREVAERFAGAEPWNKGRSLPDWVREKLRKPKWESRPHPRGMLGKKHSSETRRQMSESHSGVPKSPEHVLKLTGRGNGNWGKGLLGERNPRYGKSWTPTQRQKLSVGVKRSWVKLKANPECMAELRKIYRAASLGERNGNYRHGRSVDPQNCVEWREARRDALARDGRQCRLCGVVVDLTVHHRNGRRLDHRQGNLLTVCRSCHAIIHAAAKRWAVSRKMEKAFLLAKEIS